jgi:TetR/AcrR family transcriptional regulator, regulator of cefoperazone and chloramphenicol sensitivity
MSLASPTTLETRTRLLEAAGEIFAEQGFHDATIRDICERAGANVAAVNYHFQSKENLYTSVLRYAYDCMARKFPPTSGLTEDATPGDRLHAFVRAYLLRVFDEGKLAWFGKLISREMAHPTAALDDLVELAIRPQSQILGSIVRDIAPGLDEERTRLCMFSVIGQCLFYFHCRPVIERLFPQFKDVKPDIEKIAAHVTTLCQAGIESVARDASREEKEASS